MSGIGFGPQSANYTTTRPAADTVVSTGNTWFKDSSGPGVKDGTIVDASWLNTIIANLRGVVTNAGFALTDADDDLLARAVQSSLMNFASLGGTGTAYTMTLKPVPANLAALVGVPLHGLITAPNASGAVTLNVNGTGPIAVKLDNGSDPLPNDFKAGMIPRFIYNGSVYVVSFTATMQQNRTNTTNYVLNPNFTVNPRNVSGSIVKAAGAYGHAMWKGGSSGVTYSVAAGVATVAAGSLVQVIEDPAVADPALPALGVMTMSWVGTATVKINGAAAASSPALFTHTSGAITIEVLPGTFSNPVLNVGAAPLAFAPRPQPVEETLLSRWVRTSFAKGVTPTTGVGMASSTQGTPVSFPPNGSGTSIFAASAVSFNGLNMASTPNVQLYNPNPSTAGSNPSAGGDIVNGSGTVVFGVVPWPSVSGINFVVTGGYANIANTIGVMWLASCEP